MRPRERYIMRNYIRTQTCFVPKLLSLSNLLNHDTSKLALLGKLVLDAQADFFQDSRNKHHPVGFMFT